MNLFNSVNFVKQMAAFIKNSTSKARVAVKELSYFVIIADLTSYFIDLFNFTYYFKNYQLNFIF